MLLNAFEAMDLFCKDDEHALELESDRMNLLTWMNEVDITNAYAAVRSYVHDMGKVSSDTTDADSAKWANDIEMEMRWFTIIGKNILLAQVMPPPEARSMHETLRKFIQKESSLKLE